MTLRGSWGATSGQTVRFTIEMPEPYSGYDTVLEVTDGTSTEPLDEGLFTMMRTNGHLGYGFCSTTPASCAMRWCWKALAWTAS